MKKKIKEFKAEMASGTIEKDDLQEIYNFEKVILKKILELNVDVKNLMKYFAQTHKQMNMCDSSITNSEYALKRLDSIQNMELFHIIYQELQHNFGQYFSAILGYVSGSMADNEFYESDTKITQMKESGEFK